jgi:hypothetical protein
MGKMPATSLGAPMPPRSILAAALLVVGCAKKDPEAAAESVADRVIETELPDEGLTLQSIDLDEDGQPDIKNYYRERSDAPRLLVRKEMDLNRDGQIDVISLFDPDGNLEREELDADYDGKFDWIDHYQKGERVMSEYDTDSDGRPNVFKYYITGTDGLVHLDRKERDEDGDGAIDVWEKFSQAGEVTRTARDTDGDGRMDVRED